MGTINKLIAATLFLSLGILPFGCSPKGSVVTNAPNGELRISCTTNIVKDLVQQIGGEHVRVTAIMDGPAIDPHVYTPSPQDINVLTGSDVVVMCGLHLEAQFADALESLTNRGIPVIRITEGLLRSQTDRLLYVDGTPDPHVWFDLELWGECGVWLAEELSKIDGRHAAAWHNKAAVFQDQMKQTASEAKVLLSNISEERRVLVTAHDAFQYFARAFGFRVEAVQGLSTQSEPGLRRINELSELLDQLEIAAIFTEQSVSDRNIQALVAACRARGHSLRIGGKLYSDTAGPEGTPEATLSGAVLHNTREIAAALNVPADQSQP